jgi:serine phosphatase RsbU (regulator of sigma subunit)
VKCTRYHLAPGDALLVYTDGVTERRRGREQFGSDRLLTAAAHAAAFTTGRTAAQLVAAVRTAVERFSSAPLDDDVALLAVRAAP